MTMRVADRGIANLYKQLETAGGKIDQKQALKILDPLVANGKAVSDALELRVRTYLKLKQPEKAVPDYLRWADHRGQDDARLLRELAFQVIAAACVLIALPTVILFLFTRRIFFRAMVEGAVKG